MPLQNAEFKKKRKKKDGSIAILFPYVSFPVAVVMAPLLARSLIVFSCWCTDRSIACKFPYVSFHIGALMAPLLASSLMFLSLLVPSLASSQLFLSLLV